MEKDEGEIFVSEFAFLNIKLVLFFVFFAFFCFFLLFFFAFSCFFDFFAFIICSNYCFRPYALGFS